MDKIIPQWMEIVVAIVAIFYITGLQRLRTISHPAIRKRIRKTLLVITAIGAVLLVALLAVGLNT